MKSALYKESVRTAL